MTGYRLFFQLFCPHCNWEIELNDNQQGSCDNPRCPERHAVVVFNYRVTKVRPVTDSYHRPEKSPLRPV